MLIKGQTTEQRIAGIADRFAQGIGGYAKSLSDTASMQREQNRYDEARNLQEEALKRQEAMAAEKRAEADLAGDLKLMEVTGRQVPTGTYKAIRSGKLTLDPTLIGSLPMTRKEEVEVNKQKRQNDLIDSQINKNNRAATKPAPTYEEKLEIKARKDAETKAMPGARLESLGAEGRSKVGAIASGFQALDQMLKASDDGFGPKHVDANTPLVGRFVSDDPYTEAERTTAEVIGRLQSGGAIGTEEVKTFKEMGPRPGDDGLTRKRKLSQQRDFLKNKLTAFGMNEGDLATLGFETASKYVPKPKTNANPEILKQVQTFSDAELEEKARSLGLI